MKYAKPIGPVEDNKPADTEFEGNIRELVRGSVAVRQPESGGGDPAVSSLSALLGRVAGSSTREIDNLIGELRSLREKLQADGNRVQRDIVEYAALSQQVMQLTQIISDSMRKLPSAPAATAATEF
jgi:hypothetical protein